MSHPGETIKSQGTFLCLTARYWLLCQSGSWTENHAEQNSQLTHDGGVCSMNKK